MNLLYTLLRWIGAIPGGELGNDGSEVALVSNQEAQLEWAKLASMVGIVMVAVFFIAVVLLMIGRVARVRRSRNAVNTETNYFDAWANYRLSDEQIGDIDDEPDIYLD